MKIRSSLPSFSREFYRAVNMFVCLFVCSIRFLTAFAEASHWFLPRARWIHCKHTHPITLRSILLLFSHPRLYLPSDPFPSVFLPNPFMHILFSPCVLLSPPTLSFLVGLTRQITVGEQYKLWSSSLRSFFLSFFLSFFASVFSYFLSLTSSTYSLYLYRVTVAFYHTQWHTHTR